MGLSWAGKGQGAIPVIAGGWPLTALSSPGAPVARPAPNRRLTALSGRRIVARLKAPLQGTHAMIRMTTWVAAVLVVLIVAVAIVVCVHLWTTNLRYEIVGDGRAVHVLDRKTGTIQWIVDGEVRNSTGPYLIR